MISNTERELEKIFISYDRVLYRLKILNIKTKGGKEVTHKDLRYAVDFMAKKHPTCRWKCQKAKGKKHYILIEGYYWLTYVYFQNEKKIIDMDIEFFKTRIKLYEQLLQIAPKIIWINDLYIDELGQYFNRKDETIRKAIRKMLKADKSYKLFENGRYKISRQGIEWLCKNCFKDKYLELLENYKMELTERYIKAGYPYDIF